jgi:phage virion morphogenesis protein
MQIHITIDDKAFNEALSALKTKLKNLKPLMQEIGAMMLEDVEANFESEGFYGKAWKPSIRARKRGGKTLQDTGMLAGSITYEATADSVRLGTPVLYAPIHQFGGRAGRGKRALIHPRPFLPITKDFELPTSLKEDITFF